MSSSERASRRVSAPKGVAVYSRDMEVVKSVSGALSQRPDKIVGAEYIVIQQTSVSSLDNVCVASVLDIGMVGASVDAVRAAVIKIKQKEPTHPIFLVGEKEALVSVLEDSDVRKVVNRGFAMPMLGAKILTALNLALQSKLTDFAKNGSVDQSGSGINWRYVAGALISVGLLLYWYVTSYQPGVAESDTVLSASQLLEEQATSVPVTVQDSGDEPQAITISELNSSEVTSTDLESQVVPLPDEDVTTVEFNAEPLIAAQDFDEPLFNEYQEELLEKARAALKKGFIVGPEGGSAWHYYRQALEVNALDEQAAERLAGILTELEAEFDLAVEAGKFGRSRSIYRVFKDLSPLHGELDNMAQLFLDRFNKPVD